MGMYTELNIGISLKSVTPPKIIDILKGMTNNSDDAITPDDHPLFQTDRWTWMLRGDSYYFAVSHCNFEFDDISKRWYLTVTASIKNYCEEWQKFLDWIGPHIDTDGYIGTYRYETDDVPTLLFAEAGKVRWKTVVELLAQTQDH